MHSFNLLMLFKDIFNRKKKKTNYGTCDFVGICIIYECVILEQHSSDLSWIPEACVMEIRAFNLQMQQTDLKCWLPTNAEKNDAMTNIIIHTYSSVTYLSCENIFMAYMCGSDLYRAMGYLIAVFDASI